MPGRVLSLCLAAALAAQAAPARAEPTMSAAEFDAYTRGKTLFYGQNGRPYGAEVYRDNRRVQWSFLDGVCKEGEWYEENGMICFTYENELDPQCWTFREGGNGLIARFENDPAATQLYEVDEAGQELICLGPKVGV